MNCLETTRRLLWSVGVADATMFIGYSIFHFDSPEVFALLISLGAGIAGALALDSLTPDPPEPPSPWDD